MVILDTLVGLLVVGGIGYGVVKAGMREAKGPSRPHTRIESSHGDIIIYHNERHCVNCTHCVIDALPGGQIESVFCAESCDYLTLSRSCCCRHFQSKY